MILTPLLKERIALLPDKPGVYQMKDGEGRIIYIGKAKNLKKRVSQYFLRPQTGKVAAMVAHIHDFDFIIVHSDKEAFILEMNLIKKFYPRYNIVMKDDSHYPYIALKKDDASLKIARKMDDKRYFYFGPFPRAKEAYKTIDLLNSLYPTRKCQTMGHRECLYYHLGQCLAPCTHKIDDEDFIKMREEIRSFLNGHVEEAIATLERKMKEASDKERYEDAQQYKNQLDSIRETVARQNVERKEDKIARDVLAIAEREGYRAISLLIYRNGVLLGKKSFVIPTFIDDGTEIAELMAEYYLEADKPREIVENIEGFADEFQPLYPEIKLIHPKEGRMLEMLDIALLNAQQALDSHFASAHLNDDQLSLLEELGQLLKIKTPYRIELFDNSHLQGANPVGALVVFVNGEPAKKMYRKFHLKEEVAGDDFHSMEEITYRRYKRLKEENSAFPDLILVDGGLTAVHACLNSLKKLELDLPLFGLYKNDHHQTEGIIDEKGNLYPLNRRSSLFFMLMRMQDEVHRFAISFHRSERSRSLRHSFLDDVSGLGVVRKEKIQKHYPTLESLKNASVEELSQFLPLKVAKDLKEKIASLSCQKAGLDG